MNKIELIDAIAQEAGISKKDAKKSLDAFINITASSLANGDKIMLVGFGSFSVVKKNERNGRHPRTGSVIKIPAKKSVKFRPGMELNDKLN